MDFKRSMMYTMIGGIAVLGYMKYKDGTITRTIKNIKPMMESMVNDIKNQ